jgi:hypothetical protein
VIVISVVIVSSLMPELHGSYLSAFSIHVVLTFDTILPTNPLMILLSPMFSPGRPTPESLSAIESFLEGSDATGSLSVLIRPVGVDRKVNAGDPAER